jgi:hypothetical protein
LLYNTLKIKELSAAKKSKTTELFRTFEAKKLKKPAGPETFFRPSTSQAPKYTYQQGCEYFTPNQQHKELIALRAYGLWEEAGRPHGLSFRFWLEAEWDLSAF